MYKIIFITEKPIAPDHHDLMVFFIGDDQNGYVTKEARDWENIISSLKATIAHCRTADNLIINAQVIHESKFNNFGI
jgi:nicotinamidase-related amidase